jgi:hypothetical protein
VAEDLHHDPCGCPGLGEQGGASVAGASVVRSVTQLALGLRQQLARMLRALPLSLGTLGLALSLKALSGTFMDVHSATMHLDLPAHGIASPVSSLGRPLHRFARSPLLVHRFIIGALVYEAGFVTPRSSGPQGL